MIHANNSPFFLHVQKLKTKKIDLTAHQNHMDDMLGTILDMSDSVKVMLDWIHNHGGFEKNVLYVTADHDHYLTLTDYFPERLANLLITGKSYDITPQNNSNINAWVTAMQAGRHHHLDVKTKTEHIKDFTTWTQQDIDNVGHFWGPRNSGGNGWSWHTTRPTPLFYDGDDGCLDALEGKPYRVLGHQVEGLEGRVDQVHLHACMVKNLFGL